MNVQLVKTEDSSKYKNCNLNISVIQSAVHQDPAQLEVHDHICTFEKHEREE